MPESGWAPRSAFAGLAAASAAGRGVLVSDRDGLGLATVLARKAQLGALAARVREHYGMDLPDGPRRAAAGETAFVGTGPGAWLATCERGANAFAASLAQVLGATASVSDQSDGLAILRLTGPNVRDVLAKLVAIDVHPQAFRPGDAAGTTLSHMGVTLWRLEDGGDGAAVFELAIFRSLAGSLWHALDASAAEFGLAVVTGEHGGAPGAAGGSMDGPG